MRRFPVLAFQRNLACLGSLRSPGTQSCGVVLDRPAKLAKLWSRHLPHPRCPAARTFDSSSLWLPHPDSPVARYIEWSSGFCHTQTRQRDGVISGTPAGRESITPRMRNLRIAGWLLKRVSISFCSLRDTLPDTGLQFIYDRQMGLLKEAYRFMMSFSIVDPVRVLHEVQRQIGWVHCHLQGTLTASYETAVARFSTSLT